MPAAPPPAAAAPTAAPPSSAPPADHVDPGSDWLQESNAELESLGGDEPPPETPPETPPEGPETPPERETPPARTRTTPAETPPAAPPEERTPSNIRDLRKGYEEKTKRIKEHYEPELARLTKRLEELEKSPQVTQTKEQQERFATMEARNKELEKEIRMVNYRKSAEYLENYQKPYVAAWSRMRRDLEGIEVTDGETTRKLTDADITMLAELPLGAAHAKAREMFGDTANVVMFHVQKIVDLADAQTEALAKIEKEVETNATKTASEQKTALETRVKLFDQANKELAEKYPRWYAPANGDTEGNSLLEKGFALADLIFRPGSFNEAKLNLLPKTFREELMANKGQLTQQGQVRLHALIRNKVANHDRQVARVNALTKELRALKKELKEYRDTEPPVGGGSTPGGRGGGTGHYLEDANAELDKLNNPNLS